MTANKLKAIPENDGTKLCRTLLKQCMYLHTRLCSLSRVSHPYPQGFLVSHQNLV